MSAAGAGGPPAADPKRAKKTEPSNASAAPEAASITSAPARKYSLSVGEEPACGCCIAQAYQDAGYELDEVCLGGGDGGGG